MTDLADLPGYALLEGFSQKAFSPLEAMRAVLARVEACEPKVQALYAFDPERALREARASEARWLSGEARPLEGSRRRSRRTSRRKARPSRSARPRGPLDPAPSDAPPAARLREDGAIVFAKTTMPDYGMLSSGLSSFHPLTRNPWDLARNPGGSSAGAAAAAAAGLRPLPCRHRYRRLDPPAGRMVRHLSG